MGRVAIMYSSSIRSWSPKKLKPKLRQLHVPGPPIQLNPWAGMAQKKTTTGDAAGSSLRLDAALPHSADSNTGRSPMENSVGGILKDEDTTTVTSVSYYFSVHITIP